MINYSHLTLLVASVEALAGAGGIVPPILFSKIEKREKQNNKIIKTVTRGLLIQILLIISASCCDTNHNDPIHCKTSK